MALDWRVCNCVREKKADLGGVEATRLPIAIGVLGGEIATFQPPWAVSPITAEVTNSKSLTRVIGANTLRAASSYR